MLHGVDVSSYDSSFDVDGLAFVFVKATEGRGYINPRRADQTARAREAGCVVGFYHFLLGGRPLRPARIKAQAKYFVKHCGARDGDILAVDWERDPKGRRASSAQKDLFLRTVKELRPDHRVILYCNRSLWTDPGTTHDCGDGLWIADYRKAGEPLIDDAWLFHQHTSEPLDKNVAKFKSRAALKKWATGADDEP
ncbi:glycoside hydrolase family 25 protein [Actinomadura fibrosa]|uniref:Glycoside hydrolase family 25 protein n=1 Tax=Actinomadura fibrosa TaxID=111802 RepID=A0ABW2XLS4_9ACTN|nr:glycoside hydrolase family 25 protein [Actinomadura fibrosa]